jgi:hypothetical protein
VAISRIGGKPGQGFPLSISFTFLLLSEMYFVPPYAPGGSTLGL